MNTDKTTISPNTIAAPFIAFLREIAPDAFQYLTFDGKHYAVVIFANDEAAIDYRDAVAENTGREWKFLGVEVVA